MVKKVKAKPTFREGMRQARRLCDSHKNCDECPLNEFIYHDFCQILLSNDVIEDIERAVMDWAAEHPEEET